MCHARHMISANELCSLAVCEFHCFLLRYILVLKFLSEWPIVRATRLPPQTTLQKRCTFRLIVPLPPLVLLIFPVRWRGTDMLKHCIICITQLSYVTLTSLPLRMTSFIDPLLKTLPSYVPIYFYVLSAVIIISSHYISIMINFWFNRFYEYVFIWMYGQITRQTKPALSFKSTSSPCST